MATKTQVKDGGAHITGSLGVFNQEQSPLFISAATEYISIEAGGIRCKIVDVTQGYEGVVVDPDMARQELGGFLYFALVIEQTEGVLAYEVFYFYADSDTPWDVEAEFDFSITAREIWRTESTSPGAGRENAPVYAKEVTYTDKWEDIAPVSWVVTFGALEDSGTNPPPAPWSPYAGAVEYLRIEIDQHKGVAGVTYAKLSNLEWDDGTVNFARYHYPHPEPAVGVYLNGKSGGLDVEEKSNAGALTRAIEYNPPYIVDLSVVGVWNRVGKLMGDLRINGGFRANNYVPDTLNWDTETGIPAVLGDVVYPTVNQLRAVGTWVQTAGLVSGLTYRTAADQYDLHSGASWTLAITEASAREEPVRDDDLNIVQRVPPISATSCHADCDFHGVYLERRDDVGIYGPNDALSHPSWAPTGGVTRPNSDGYFVVIADGSLTLTIPCDFEGRMDDVPLGLAPEGCPVIYLTRKANYYYPERPFNEGVYSWLGWQNLEIPITAPAAGVLQLTLPFRWYSTLNDNHRSDASRTTEFSYDFESGTVTRSIMVDAGAQTVIVQIMARDPYPLLERVVSMCLSGFGAGEWIIGEPVLAKADTGRVILKTHEGREYYEGGASFHTDAAYEYYDALEDNLGSANLAEETMRFFDRIIGHPSGLDLTTAYSLVSFASIIERVGEVFLCHKNTAACEDALTDDEEPPNTLSGLYAFSICYPNADTMGDNYPETQYDPLEQAIS